MKSPEAFRTISEVAADLDLPQHVLRFWESRFTQVKPMKRGGGRRYYRPEDVDLLRGIRLLLYGEGFTIRGVQRLLKEKGVGFVASAGRAGSVETVTAADDIDEAEDETAAAAESVAPAVVAESVRVDEANDDEPSSAPVPVAAPETRERIILSLGPERRRALEAAIGELEEAKRALEQVR